MPSGSSRSSTGPSTRASVRSSSPMPTASPNAISRSSRAPPATVEEIKGRRIHLLEQPASPLAPVPKPRTPSAGQGLEEILGQRKNGGPSGELALHQSVRNQHGIITHFIEHFIYDIGERKRWRADQLPRLLRRSANLPNRTLLARRFDEMARHSLQRDRQVALRRSTSASSMINDSLGHRVGDQVLQTVGERLASARDQDTVAPMPATVRVSSGRRPELRQTARYAQRMIDAVFRPMCIEGRELHQHALRNQRIATRWRGSRNPARQRHYRPAHGRPGRAKVFASSPKTSMRPPCSAWPWSKTCGVPSGEGALELHYQPEPTLPAARVVGVGNARRFTTERRQHLAPMHFIDCRNRTDPAPWRRGPAQSLPPGTNYSSSKAATDDHGGQPFRPTGCSSRN
ncbi:diguanylate cyclase [Billgrantia gudaonensis]|uniref:Diguanylate cyclase n=1 Tax=Billgrantia gudaonensis TaxID=376427 RepID=A0A432JIM5_9GAMM|nr:diguanylate cyclase [Halomonas gudaonensis]